jgi:hypothetical protein
VECASKVGIAIHNSKCGLGLEDAGDWHVGLKDAKKAVFDKQPQSYL